MNDTLPCSPQALEWKDYLRGKDIARWLRQQQQLLDEHTRPQGAGAASSPVSLQSVVFCCTHIDAVAVAAAAAADDDECLLHMHLHLPTSATTPPSLTGRSQEDQVADLVGQLLSRRLLLPAERRFKKPKPGRTKLVKWPRTLDVLPVRVCYEAK
jgi:hypothetical protein